MPDALQLFINYRRADHPDFVEHLRAHFMFRYGRANVFMDFDSIPPFAQFEDFIRQKVRETDALVAIIGPNWVQHMKSRASDGKPDYVLIELTEALRHGKVIAPICIQNASVPSLEDVPEELHPIFERHIPRLHSGRDILDNIPRIMDALEAALAQQGNQRTVEHDEDLADSSQPQLDIFQMFDKYYEALDDDNLPGALIWLAQIREQDSTLPSFFDVEAQEDKVQERIRVEEEARRRQEVAEYLYRFVRILARRNRDVCEALLEVWQILPDYDPDSLGSDCAQPPPPPARLPFEPEMVRIPAGPFLMGSPTSDKLRYRGEPEQYELLLDYDYAIGKYPVTVGQYAAFIDAGGYRERSYWTDAGWKQRESDGWKEPRYWDDDKWTGNDLLPVVGVSWYEAFAYCHWLAEATGRDYRLLTEAEWEKAARGGLTLADGSSNPNPARIWPWGDEKPSKELCNFEGNVGQTSPVNSHPAQAERQPYGLHHMAGNVWEWCLSEWADSYTHPEKNESQGDNRRVLRGGSWHPYYSPQDVRCSFRSRYYALNGYGDDGFRVGGVFPVLA